MRRNIGFIRENACCLALFNTSRRRTPMIAIIPAGGRGTRMAAVTHGASKEALPLGGRTVLDFVLDEAFASGAARAVVVSAREKSDVEPIVSARKEHVDLRYQDEPRGLAHAIAAANEVEEDALILLPDTVFSAFDSTLRLAKIEPTPDAAILAEVVRDADVQLYGILECDLGKVSKILEKPHSDETPSRLAVAARYFLTDRVLRLVHECVAAQAPSGEWDLTSVLNRAILHSMTIAVVKTDAHRYDCGSPEGYREACAHFSR
jgi:UTP--glucose-1-phosphate uridylyltransferase